MNNLERESKQYDVLVMETSTQEKIVTASGWCVPVKHVAKLSRMRGSTSTDDHTGESLDAKKVKEARQLEMEYYDKMHVFDKGPIAQCWRGQARHT